MKAKPTRPDVLARVDLLAIPDMHVEAQAKLPTGFLSKARKGKNYGPKAAESWEKLVAWLDARQGPPVVAATSPSGSSVATVASVGALEDAMRDTGTLEKADAAIELLLGEMATGRVAPTEGRAMIEGLKEKRQLLVARAKEQAQVQAGQPIKTEVVWSQKCPHCGGAIGDYTEAPLGGSDGDDDEDDDDDESAKA